MKMNEGVQMKKRDWLYAGIASLILMMMLLSNIWLMIILLSRNIVFFVLYTMMLFIILFFLTFYRIRMLEFSEKKSNHWINDNLLLWMLTDFHALTLLLRYIIPGEQQGTFLPEVFFLIHLFLVLIVLYASRALLYQKHRLLITYIAHILLYGLLSYSFIQLIIQTMQ